MKKLIRFKSSTFLSKKPFSVSYVNGLSNKSLEYKSIGNKLIEIASKYPDNLAVISHKQNIRLTYHEFLEKVLKISASFHALGLEKHDRIGIYSPNNAEWAITQFAASMSNLILVNINPAYRIEELKYSLNKVECKALVMAGSFKSSNYVEYIRKLAPEVEHSKPNELKSENLPNLKLLIRIDDEITNDLYDYHDNEDIIKIQREVRYISPDEPTNIQYTSGTTGFPKASTLTHFNILNNGKLVGERLHYTNKDVICISVPLYHCFGMVLGNLGAVSVGATMVFPDEGFNPNSCLESISNYKCTSVYGVPTMFIEMLNALEKDKETQKKFKVKSLEKGIMAGTLCPRVLMERVITEMNLKKMAIAYGMTETSPVSFMTKADDSIDKRVSSVGTILPTLEAKVIDDRGLPTPRNSAGELCIRGHSVMKMYWGDEAATKKAIDEDGWMHSGDLAILDHNDYLYIVGRIKDMIIRGGENVYPKEIEEYLMKYPNVEKVEVIGVDDKKYGEEIAALIKLKDLSKKIDKMEILKFCKDSIAHYKIPKYVKFVDSFPITITGKPQKYKMKEEMTIELKNKDLEELYKIRK